jgi:hypothetical protein
MIGEGKGIQNIVIGVSEGKRLRNSCRWENNISRF